MVSSMKNKLEDSILDSENAYKTITSLENQLCCTKKTLELEKKSHHELSKKTKVQIETLTLLNETLKKENVESRKLFKKNNEELKNEINKKEKLVTNIIAKNEKLQTKNKNLEFEKEELARKVKHHKSTISELETKAVEPPTKSTKTPQHQAYKILINCITIGTHSVSCQVYLLFSFWMPLQTAT